MKRKNKIDTSFFDEIEGSDDGSDTDASSQCSSQRHDSVPPASPLPVKKQTVPFSYEQKRFKIDSEDEDEDEDEYEDQDPKVNVKEKEKEKEKHPFELHKRNEIDEIDTLVSLKAAPAAPAPGGIFVDMHRKMPMVIVVSGPRYSGKTHTVTDLLGVANLYPLIGSKAGILRECLCSVRYTYNANVRGLFRISYQEATKDQVIRKVHAATVNGWNVGLDMDQFRDPLDENRKIHFETFDQVLLHITTKLGYLDPIRWTIIVESSKFKKHIEVIETPDLDLLSFVTAYECIYAHKLILMCDQEILERQEKFVQKIRNTIVEFSFSCKLDEIASYGNKNVSSRIAKWDEAINDKFGQDRKRYVTQYRMFLETVDQKDIFLHEYQMYHKVLSSIVIKNHWISDIFDHNLDSFNINIPTIDFEKYITRVELGVKNPAVVADGSIEFRMKWNNCIGNGLRLRELALKSLIPTTNTTSSLKKNIVLTEMVLINSIMPTKNMQLDDWLLKATNILLDIAHDKGEYDHAKAYYKALREQQRLYKKYQQQQQNK